MKLKTNTLKLKVRNIVIVIAFPLIMYLLMELVCFFCFGEHIMKSAMDINNYLKNCCIMSLSALALSLNMSCGRIDLSLGAQQLAACIIGGNLAFSLGFSALGVILFSCLFGILLGLLTGFLFIKTKIPSMILGISMALIYECIANIYANGQGIQYFGKADVQLLSDMRFEIVVSMIILIIFILLFKYTKFGYNYNAIRGSQRIALATGINIYKNTLICYMMAGGLIALSGVFDIAYKGSMTNVMGMTSTSAAFTGIMPVIIAGYIARFCSMPAAIVSSVCMVRLLSTTLSIAGFSSASMSAINMLLLIAVLVGAQTMNRLNLNRQCKLRITEVSKEAA